MHVMRAAKSRIPGRRSVVTVLRTLAARPLVSSFPFPVSRLRSFSHYTSHYTTLHVPVSAAPAGHGCARYTAD